MQREFLKNLGLEDEAINAVMGEYGKSINTIKADKEKIEAEFTASQESMNKLQEQLKTLESSTTTVEELKEQLKARGEEFETFKADTQKREVTRTKTQSLAKELEEAGFMKSSIDLLIPTFDLEKIQLDSKNKIVDRDEIINPVKEARKELLVTRQIESDAPRDAETPIGLDDPQVYFDSQFKKK